MRAATVFAALSLAVASVATPLPSGSNTQLATPHARALGAVSHVADGLTRPEGAQAPTDSDATARPTDDQRATVAAIMKMLAPRAAESTPVAASAAAFGRTDRRQIVSQVEGLAKTAVDGEVHAVEAKALHVEEDVESGWEAASKVVSKTPKTPPASLPEASAGLQRRVEKEQSLATFIEEHRAMADEGSEGSFDDVPLEDEIPPAPVAVAPTVAASEPGIVHTVEDAFHSISESVNHVFHPGSAPAVVAAVGGKPPKMTSHTVSGMLAKVDGQTSTVAYHFFSEKPKILQHPAIQNDGKLTELGSQFMDILIKRIKAGRVTLEAGHIVSV